MSVHKNKRLTNEITQCRQDNDAELARIDQYWRLVNYLAAAQIYLEENFLL